MHKLCLTLHIMYFVPLLLYFIVVGIFFFNFCLDLQLEQRVNEIEQFYLYAKIKEPNTSRSASILKDKEKEKHIPSMKKLHQDASRREAAAAKRMQELMRHFGTIFRQACLHTNI